MNEHQSTTLATGFAFLEGPRWHDSSLWVSDMWTGDVLRIDENGASAPVCIIPGRPSGIGFLPDGTPLVVSMADRCVMRLGPAGLERYADLGAIAGGDCNDMLVDPVGRAYVGNFGFDLHSGAPHANADLAVVDCDGGVRIVAKDLNFPNGMVLIDGGRTLVLAEGWARRLLAFDRAEDGSLSNRRVYADLGHRSPDGLCVDRDDGIWVACYDSAEFLRVAINGEITDRVAVPGRHAVACAIGGADGRTLFCCVLAGDYEAAMRGERNGRIEIARVAIAGQ